MNVLDIGIEGIGVWSAELPGWGASGHAFCADVFGTDVFGTDVFSTEVEKISNTASRPAPSLLAPTERRRAPDSVLLALEVAQQACAMAGRDPRTLPNVFASAYGDLAINDYLCATLARSPQDVSPTKFHNSVHNAPAGYWSIATGCMESSTAISAGEATFGAGLLEAALLAQRESRAVLLAAYDIAATGPLADVVPCRTAFGVALVLAPASPRAVARLRVQLQHAATTELASDAGVLHACHRDNPAARSLPLLTALARREPQTLMLAAGARMNLRLEISF